MLFQDRSYNARSILLTKDLFIEMIYFQDIPIVVVGNKVDTIREIEPEDINDWVESDLPKERYRTEFATLKIKSPLNSTNYWCLFQNQSFGMFCSSKYEYQ